MSDSDRLNKSDVFQSTKCTECVSVGDYEICRYENTPGIFINHCDGEGGQFDETKLEKVIADFYAKHF